MIRGLLRWMVPITAALITLSVSVVPAVVAEPLVVPLGASVYYVAVTGSNSNSGTEGQSWRTIEHAVDSVGAGDTILVRSGTYRENISLWKSGEEGAPITLKAYEGEVVTIDGGSDPVIADYTGTSYWVIEGLRLLSSGSEACINFDAWGSQGTNYWVIRDNYIAGAIKIYGNHNLVEGNEVDGSLNPSANDGGNGVEDFWDVSHHNIYRDNEVHHFNVRGMWSCHKTHDNLWEDNHVHHIQGEPESMGIDPDGYGNVEWRHVLRGNRIHDVSGGGIELENCFDCVVENNIIYNTGLQGINVINYYECESAGGYGDNNCHGDITNNIIRQNLIYDGGWEGGIVSHSAGGVTILGNTITRGKGNGIGIYGNSPEWEIRGNIIIDNNWEAIVTDGNILAANDHNLLSDARFMDPGSNDYHLRSDSDAIDAGIEVGMVVDLEGIPRPQGAGYDIGAYEFGSAAPPPTPTLPPANYRTSIPLIVRSLR